jgi:hypothetical protein
MDTFWAIVLIGGVIFYFQSNNLEALKTLASLNDVLGAKILRSHFH